MTKFIAILAFTQLALAGEAFETISKSSELLKKTPSCTFAMGLPLGKGIDPKILCVVDMVIGQATINESKGCTLGEYNIRTGTMGWTYADASHRNNAYPKSHKKCSEGGFADLMDQTAMNLDLEGKVKFSVRDVLAHGFETSDTRKSSHTIFLFGAHPGYKKLWDQEVPKAR